MDKEILDDLWEDFLSIAESHSEIDVKEFGAAMILFASKMLFDLHPHATDIIKIAVEEGFEWSKADKKDESK